MSKKSHTPQPAPPPPEVKPTPPTPPEASPPPGPAPEADPFEALEAMQAQRAAEAGRAFLALAVELADGARIAPQDLAKRLDDLDRSPAELRDAVERIKRRDKLLSEAAARKTAQAKLDTLAARIEAAEAEQQAWLEAFQRERLDPLHAEANQLTQATRSRLSDGDLRRKLADCCPDPTLHARRLEMQARRRDIEMGRAGTYRTQNELRDGLAGAFEELAQLEQAMVEFDPRSPGTAPGTAPTPAPGIDDRGLS